MSAAIGAFRLLAETIEPDELNKVRLLILTMDLSAATDNADHSARSSASTSTPSFAQRYMAGAKEDT